MYSALTVHYRKMNNPPGNRVREAVEYISFELPGEGAVAHIDMIREGELREDQKRRPRQDCIDIPTTR